jgi:hypothetical protein
MIPILALEARRAGIRKSEYSSRTCSAPPICGAPSFWRTLTAPSRTWLLSTGPAGLGRGGDQSSGLLLATHYMSTEITGIDLAGD